MSLSLVTKCSLFGCSGEVGDQEGKLAVGMIFRTREDFKQHMALYAISQKFCFRNAKSDPTMMILKCCGRGCPWHVYAVRLKDCDVFEIRTYESRHQCTIDERGGYQNQATASVIGMLMRTKFAGTGGGPRPGEIR